MDRVTMFLVNFLHGLGFSLMLISVLALYFSDVGLIAFLLKVMFVFAVVMGLVLSAGDD